MKKSYLFSAFAAGMVMQSACSNDGDLTGGDESNDAVQQIVLQVANAGDGLQTRAGRPLYSSEALQTIENVRVLVYKNDAAPAEGGAAPAKTIVLDKTLNWKESKDYATTDNGDHGRQLTIFLKGGDKLPQGSYKIMAVGYSNKSDYTFSVGADYLTEETLAGKNKVYTDVKATLTPGKKAEEVFAGDAQININADQEVTNNTNGENGVVVTMHRQVAGGLGYFTNIPAKVDGVKAKYLRLVMRKSNDVLTFNNFNSSFISDKDETSKKYVVNGGVSDKPFAADACFKGATANNGYVLYSIDLDKWFPKGDANMDGVLGYDDYKKGKDAGLTDENNIYWKHPKDVNTTVVKGSVFAGNFIIPFTKEDGNKTMELQLLDANNNILMIWNVTIPKADMNNDKTKGVVDESESIFNVVRNHMYNLGMKKTQGGNPDPENPDPKPDPDPEKPDPDHKPEDLSKGQNLILKVNDNWEAIHQLVID